MLVYLYSLTSRRLEETVFNIPLIFTLSGLLLALAVPGMVRREVGTNVWLLLAEITYSIVLFNGATSVNMRALRAKTLIPGRLLLIGLPLTILFGMAASALVLPDLSIWEAGLLACILASTDTGLADLVTSSRLVPASIRDALNAESGLSDGLVIPAIMIFISLIKTDSVGLGLVFLRITGQQIGYGIPIGAAIGFVGGWMLGLASRRGWAIPSFQQIAMVTLVPISLILSKAAGTSPFIAAFTAGLTVRIGFREAAEGIADFSKNEGRLLQMFAFFLFGTTAGMALSEIRLSPILYAILSLTLVRMIPVAISLIGTHLSSASVLFIGWFGPRGLASIVLGLVLVQQELVTPGDGLIRLGLIATVLISVFAHALSAAPGVRLYAQQIARLGADAPEKETIPEILYTNNGVESQTAVI